MGYLPHVHKNKLLRLRLGGPQHLRGYLPSKAALNWGLVSAVPSMCGVVPLGGRLVWSWRALEVPGGALVV